MKWLRRLSIAAGAVLLLNLVLWLAVPRLIVWQAQTRGAAWLERPVSVGAADFKPWSLELTLSKLVVGGKAPSDEPLLAFDRLHANLAFWPLLRGVPVVQALEVDAPRMHVARIAAGRYDIDDLIAKLSRPAAEPSSKPTRFALYNLQVRDARLAFDDRPAGGQHVLESLQLSLPFLSNLPEKVEVNVEPRLAFRLHGAAFDSGAQATPFAPTHHGVLRLAVSGLDVKPYLGYLPQSLPVRLSRGVLSGDLSLEFSQAEGREPSAALRGWVGAQDVALDKPGGGPLLAWKQLRLALRDVQPLARRLAFESLRLEGAELKAGRDRAGRFDLLQASPAPSPAPAAPAQPAQVPAWQVTLDALDLVNARVLWSDASLEPAAALQLDDVSLQGRQLRWPTHGPMPLKLAATLRSAGDAAPPAGSFTVEGTADEHQAQLKLGIASVALQALAPYVGQAVVPAVQGDLSAQGRLDWSDAAQAPRLQLVLEQAGVEGLRVQPAKGGEAGMASLERLSVADAQVDLLARQVALGSVKLLRPSLEAARNAEGRLNLAAWLRPGGDEPAAPAAPPWRLTLRSLSLEGGRVRWSDAAVPGASPGRPLRAELQQLTVGVQDFAWPAERRAAPAKLQLRVQVAPLAGAHARALPAGSVDWKGDAAVQPVQATGQLRIVRFPAHLLAPYVSDSLPVRLLRAEAGYTGRVSVREQRDGWAVAASGDALLGDVHVTTVPDASAAALAGGADELLNWQALTLQRLEFAMKPGSRPRLEIGAAALNDFYASLVVTEQGHLNLRDVAAPPAAASAPVAASPASTPAPASPASAPALPLDIVVGGTTLSNGHIDFTDHFVRPNYSADLTELNGELGPFSSASRDMATLQLRGRAARTALLEISGQLNPTVKPPALDIKARATDLELPPLSPYAGKYAGYAIERGKLSLDVAYKIDEQGRLEASNQLVLNQLTFGERVDSPSATKLPVLLAVALLKDRNGVIDINLPISGSLDDPQFSVGGLIVKVIVNLLAKALTAPFALLAGGGKDDLSLVAFNPGTAVIADSSAATIDKVARALNDRPALRMTVTGAADPAAEREAYQRAVIEERLLAERRRQALRAGEAASAPAAALGAEQRARLVKRLYEQTDLPDKPRNVLGFAKELPVPEMEALLRKHVPVTEETMRGVALQRGLAVRDALIAKGLPGERLFLAAPKLRVPAGEDASAAWTPQVQLSLSTR